MPFQVRGRISPILPDLAVRNGYVTLSRRAYGNIDCVEGENCSFYVLLTTLHFSTYLWFAWDHEEWRHEPKACRDSNQGEP
jgi:hypothetical protein